MGIQVRVSDPRSTQLMHPVFSKNTYFRICTGTHQIDSGSCTWSTQRTEIWKLLRSKDCRRCLDAYILIFGMRNNIIYLTDWCSKRRNDSCSAKLHRSLLVELEINCWRMKLGKLQGKITIWMKCMDSHKSPTFRFAVISWGCFSEPQGCLKQESNQCTLSSQRSDTCLNL